MAIRDPERYFDRRTFKRHLKRGHASEGDYQSYLDSLPDMSENIKPAQEGGDDDGFEARAQAKARRQSGLSVSMGEPGLQPHLITPGYPPLKRAPIESFDDDDDDDDDDFDDDDDDDDDDDGPG